MPRQNRVDPLGTIVAHPARGMLMGNRGCLHDDDGRILRTHANRAWISCVPTRPGVRRTLMAPRCYTELFFLDEPTALAAGHRPCGQCRPEQLSAFKAAWRKANRLDHDPTVAEIDRVLRAERHLPQKRCAVAALPDGAMYRSTDGEGVWLKWDRSAYRWSFDGYLERASPGDNAVTPITPASMISVIGHGYVPELIGQLPG